MTNEVWLQRSPAFGFAVPERFGELPAAAGIVFVIRVTCRKAGP
jgi:hypothetical protein